MSLGTAGLVISGGDGQTTVPVTPAEASADAAALGSLVGVGYNAANVTGSVGGSGSAEGPVVFTGGTSERRRGMGSGGAVIVICLHFVLLVLGWEWGQMGSGLNK